jgi:hypothetical protein
VPDKFGSGPWIHPSLRSMAGGGNRPSADGRGLVAPFVSDVGQDCGNGSVIHGRVGRHDG